MSIKSKAAFLARALLVAAALFGVWPRSASAEPDFAEWAAPLVASLHSWFAPDCPWWNPFDPCHFSSGLYKTTGWWNSANIIEAVIDYTDVTNDWTYWSDVTAAFDAVDDVGTIGRGASVTDDEGWWALTWIRAFDVSSRVPGSKGVPDKRFLERAKFIFRDMATFWDSSACGGGLWWCAGRGICPAQPGPPRQKYGKGTFRMNCS